MAAKMAAGAKVNDAEAGLGASVYHKNSAQIEQANVTDTAKPSYDYIVLVLQGGGALGAYQAGIFEGMAEAGYAPNWVAGVSIGAINAALIAGNPDGHRVERLREFWNLVSSGLAADAPTFFDPLHHAFNRASAALSAVVGVPGFYAPRVPPAMLVPDGHPNALSVYDTSLLRSTLTDMVDFDLINRRDTRFSVGAVNVHTGNSTYFDNEYDTIELDHVMASGALPPAFAPVEIDGSHFWDGGIVSNTPLWYVLDESPTMQGLIVQVDLFNARGELPQNLDQVMERHKDIIYSSKTRFNTSRVTDQESLRNALQRVLKRLPADLANDPDVRALSDSLRGPKIDIVHLINRRYSYTSSSKDNDFSRATVKQLWESGLDDARRTIHHPEWLRRSTMGEGIRVFDLAH
jgi:NTE family protein